MEQLKAHFAKDGKAYPDGLHDLACPICKSLHKELEIEQYYEKDSDRYIECCTDCRESFEQDMDYELDSDTLEPAVFTDFLVHSHESMDIDELKTDKSIREIDPDKWTSITGIPSTNGCHDNTIAIWYFPCGCWFEEVENYGKPSFQVIIGNAGWSEDTPEAATRHLHYWHSGEHTNEETL